MSDADSLIDLVVSLIADSVHYLELVFLVALIAPELFQQGAPEAMSGVVITLLAIVAQVASGRYTRTTIRIRIGPRLAMIASISVLRRVMILGRRNLRMLAMVVVGFVGATLLRLSLFMAVRMRLLEMLVMLLLELLLVLVLMLQLLLLLLSHEHKLLLLHENLLRL